MMQTCPRCGFVQPEDKYCANCGLDIENYKPAPTPLFQKVVKNTAVQIGAVVLIVIAVTIAILLSQNNRVEKRLSAASKIQNSHTLRMPHEQAQRPVHAPHPVQQPHTVSVVQQAPKKPTREKKVHGIAVPKELFIGFYEMSRAALMQLAGEGQVLSESAESRSMTLPTRQPFQKLREKDPETRPLGEVIRQKLKQGQPINLDFTRPVAADAGMAGIGATMSLNPTKVNAADVELGFDLVFNMRNKTGNSLITNEVNSSFSFSPESTLVLSGFFPHRKVFRQDLLAFSGTPIAIFASPAFQNSVTDFVIVIQAK